VAIVSASRPHGDTEFVHPTRSWSHRLGQQSKRLLRPGFLLVMVLWSIVPIIWNVLTSFKSRADIFASPPKFIFEPDFSGWQAALSSEGAYSVHKAFLNSVVISVGTTALVLSTGTLAAFAIVLYRFRWRKAVLLGLLATRLIPPVAALVPLFLILFRLDLLDTRRGLVLVLSALGIPFAVWLLKSFMEAIPRDLFESAHVDGCRAFQVFRHIALPLTAPGIAATAAFTFLIGWNHFLFAFMFTNFNARPLTVQLLNVQGEDTVLWGIMTAQTTILLIPAVLLGLFLQRYLVEGLTAGSIK
jgi:multiple sugar transport system permease protein